MQMYCKMEYISCKGALKVRLATGKLKAASSTIKLCSAIRKLGSNSLIDLRENQHSRKITLIKCYLVGDLFSSKITLQNYTKI